MDYLLVKEYYFIKYKNKLEVDEDLSKWAKCKYEWLGKLILKDAIYNKEASFLLRDWRILLQMVK